MKKTNFFVMSVMSMLLVFCSNLHPLIDFNDIVPAFPLEKQVEIEGAVIEGAIHYLEAQSLANLLLKEIEKSTRQSMNYTSAMAYTDKAIGEVEKAIEKYDQAIYIGKQAGYQDNVIQKFKGFNYEKFSSARRLNQDIMTLVKAYFTGGNIVGAYRHRVENLSEILIMLHQIKEKLVDQQTPEISLFWNLYQRFSEASLFGNYCTLTANAVFMQ